MADRSRIVAFSPFDGKLVSIDNEYIRSRQPPSCHLHAIHCEAIVKSIDVRDRPSPIIRRLDGRVVPVELLSLSLSGGEILVVTGHSDCTVRIWNPEDGSSIGMYQGKFGGFSEALRLFAIVDWKSVVHLHSF